MSEAHRVVIGGTIAIDNVKTHQAEEKNLLGGSAAYASLSASFFTKDVYLVGIVGKDFPKEHLSMLERHGVDLSGVEHSDGESFTWTGEYAEDINKRETLQVGLNVLENWTVKVPAKAAEAEGIVLANMSPENQLQMLAQCKNRSFVIADTMDLWINISSDKLAEVIKQIQIFVLNESEAKLLAKTSNIVAAGKKILAMGSPFVVIKLGEYGAMLFGQNGEIFRTPAWPLENVADPTGAGDCFLGALAGFLASQNGPLTCKKISQGMAYGSVTASFDCEDFSTHRLEKTTRQEIEARLSELKRISSW